MYTKKENVLNRCLEKHVLISKILKKQRECYKFICFRQQESGLSQLSFGKEQKAQESLTPDTMPIGFGHGPSRANDTPGIKHWQMK